jgi:hypothetical protein
MLCNPTTMLKVSKINAADAGIEAFDWLLQSEKA